MPIKDDMPDPRQIEIYKKMTPQDKLRAFQRLYWQAWEVKKAGFKMMHPEWDDEQVTEEVRKIFIRTVTWTIFHSAIFSNRLIGSTSHISSLVPWRQ